MNVFQHYFEFGLALFIICANQNCKADKVVECPNLPITPYSPVQTTNPTLPLNLGAMQPTIQTTGQNQLVFLVQLVYSGSVQPISPYQTPPSPCQIIYGLSPHCSCLTTPSICCQTKSIYPSPTSSCQITTTIPTTLSPPTTLPPTATPAILPPTNIIKCPSGTILIGKKCHLLYCPPGSVMKNDRCVIIECPEGTTWTGQRCSVPEPIVKNFTFNNTITTYVNPTTSNIIFNSTKNIMVNLPLIKIEENNNNINCSNDTQDCHEETTKEITRTIQKCCEVMTPRICEKRNKRWHCYSRRSRRCGDFCIAPIIYLKPSRVYARPNYVVLPPIQKDCDAYGICGSMIGGHDCSGCFFNNMLRCSYYCYRYSCPSQKCEFFDHQKYCTNNVDDMFGCQEVDGCYDDWCLNDKNSF